MKGKPAECITWLVRQNPEEQFQVKVYREKESRKLTQNALYWEFLQKLADVLRMDKAECHNRMLRSYGQRWITEDGEVIEVIRPDTDEEERRILKDEKTHLVPTSQIVFDKGTQKRIYHLLRGSSLYTSKEMSILIDGLLEECRQQHIDTTRLEDREILKEAMRRKGA